MKKINHAHDPTKLEDILATNFDNSHPIFTVTYDNKHLPAGKGRSRHE